MGIRSSHMCVQHPVQSLTQSQCLDPPPSNNQSAAPLWGSFHPLGSGITRGFAHTLTLGSVLCGSAQLRTRTQLVIWSVIWNGLLQDAAQ